MFERDAIIDQVLHNCDISDAQNAGVYSICGLALRLRDLYKWEKKLDPWIEKDASEVLEWIENKENRWDELTETEFQKIIVGGIAYDPFDTEGINFALAPYGLFYGAGYAYSLKPTFFLSTLEDKQQIKGHMVYILGRELARDLFSVPALSQDDCILIRKESAKLFLWDKIFYIGNSGRQALRFALKNYGLEDQSPEQLHDNLAKISSDETKAYIYHELGEIKDTIFDRDIWREIIAAYPHTPVELLVRTVKDLLADTNAHGTFRYIVGERKTASLGFYVAFREGLRKELFPELTGAFREFIETHNWRLIEEAVSAGFNTAKRYAETICDIYLKGKLKNDKKWAEDEIRKRFIEPLGV